MKWILCFLSLSGFAQGIAEVYREAQKAIAEENHTLLLEKAEILNQMRPQHPAVYELMSLAELRNGDREKSEFWLKKILVQKLTREVRHEELIEAFPELVAELKKPLVSGHVEVFSEHDETGLIPEGIAIDPKHQTFYVSSVRKHKIFAFQAGSTWHEVTEINVPLGFFGITFDSKHRQLLISANGFEGTLDVVEPGKSGVLAFDVDQKNLQAFYLDEEGHNLNDFVEIQPGHFMVSCNMKGNLFSFDMENGLEEVLPGGILVSPQGMVTWGSERILVADYPVGLMVVDLKTKKVEPLPLPDDLCSMGIDGLVRSGSKVYAIQNGIRPNRVIEMKVANDKVSSWKVLAADHELFDEPTLGMVFKQKFYFIGNSQWPALGEGSKMRDVSLQGPKIMTISLDSASND